MYINLHRLHYIRIVGYAEVSKLIEEKMNCVLNCFYFKCFFVLILHVLICQNYYQIEI